MPAAPVLESPGARQPAKESTAPASGLGSDEGLASVVYGSAAVPEAMVGTARSSGAEAGVIGVALESEAEKPAMLEEQTVLPKAFEGVVGHAVRPQSSLWVPPAMEEEDEVEEIEREES